jgi:hypothetical protein
VIVGVDQLVALARLDADRRDLLGEAALLHGGGAKLVTAQRVGVLLLAPDVEPARDALGGLRHHRVRVRVVEAAEQRVLHLRRLAEREAAPRSVQHVGRLAHVLRPGREHGRGLAEQDELRAAHDRLDARAAQAVHCERRRRHGHAGLESDVARAVERVDRRLQHVADDDVVDRLRVDARALERGLRGVHAEVERADLLELAVPGGPDVLAHGRPRAPDDDDFVVHCCSLSAY